MLPLAGEKLSQGKPDESPLFMASCVVTAQLVMVPMAILVGRKADAWGRKPLFLAGFAVLPLRGLLFALADNPYAVVAIQILDGVGAGIFGALFYIVVADFTRGTGRFNLAQGAAAACWGMGAALSNGVAGMIVNGFGFSAAFFFLGACALGALGIYFFAVPSPAITGPRPGRNRAHPFRERRAHDGGRHHGLASRNLEHRGLRDERGDLSPWGLPEAIWAVVGATALVLSALLPWQDAMAAVSTGTDVYLFLTGMMLLAEVARREGLLDWLAGHATEAAKGSPGRLFGLIYVVGIIVTVFLSNDATAVVLTPAVYAAAKTANAKPLPYLVACAFIANAASFVLPISNPANLVFYGNHIPALWPWLRQFALPSILSIAATYAVLRFLFRKDFRGTIEDKVAVSDLSNGGRYAAYGIAATAIALLIASALDSQLGAPTFAAGAATAFFVLIEKREAPWPLVGGISWGVLPLVAGLFVLVQGLNNTGVVRSSHRTFEVGRFAIGIGDVMVLGRRARAGDELHEQPAGGPDRRIRGDARASALGCYGCAPDRRRPRA